MGEKKIVTVTLDEVIERGEQKIGILQIRKPGAGELRGLNLRDLVQADVDAMITLLPRVTSPPITEEEAAAMDVADFLACCNEVASFLPQQGAIAGSRPQ